MRRNRIAYKIAMKALSDVTDMISPSEHIKKVEHTDPKHLIMQKDKVQHSFFDLPGDADDFEDIPEFDDVSYLVRYMIEDDGSKRKKDSF